MRLEITRRAELAVRSLALLAGSPGVRWKAPALAEVLATTPAFVPQVIGPLVKAGWVRSDPGPTGGYAATVAADEVSVLDVIEAVDGATDAGRCVVADRRCNASSPCSVHVAWAAARHELLAALAASTLVGIAAQPSASLRAPVPSGHPDPASATVVGVRA